MKKRKRLDKAIGSTDKVAGKIARFIIRVQSAFSIFMTRRTEHLSVTSFKTLLIVFLLTGGALNVWFVAESLQNKPSVLQSMRAGQWEYSNCRINDTVKSIQLHADQFISSVQYGRLQWYISFMDSLKADHNGHRIYDSMMQVRPGLVDSIKTLLKMYNRK